MRWVLVTLINLYQAHISPRKGFCCAHRRLHGGQSCSEAIKQLIVSQGIRGSFSGISARFRACKNAADMLQNAPMSPLRSDLDCGLSGCIGCADLGGAEACFLGSGSAASTPVTRPAVFVPVGVVSLLLILACLYWFHGRQIELIEIKLIDAAQETRDKQLAKLFKQQLPDYQIILDVNGRTEKTNTLKNSSAANWLQLRPSTGIYRSDIDRFSIINKQILKNQILEEFSEPAATGSGKYYRYRIRNNWELF